MGASTPYLEAWFTASEDPAPRMLFLVVFVLLAVGVSFLCSLLESVLLSITPAYVQVVAESHPRRGERLRRLVDGIDRPLAAILSLNTVAHTVGATGAGAEAARVFGSAWVGLFSAVLTLAILVLSEIIPKTIGAVYWRELTPFVSRVLPWMIGLLLPLVWLSGWLTRLLRHGEPAGVSREEISAMADIGHVQGVIERHESDLLRSLLRFRDVAVDDVMTPMPVVGHLRAGQTVDEAIAAGHPFSRLPIVEDDGRARGYVLRDELLEAGSSGESGRAVDALARPLIPLDRNVALPEALERFINQREHVAIVVGDDARPVGVITLEDVVETLLDVEIVDEADPAVDMRLLARQLREQREQRLRRQGVSAD